MKIKNNSIPSIYPSKLKLISPPFLFFTAIAKDYLNQINETKEQDEDKSSNVHIITEEIPNRKDEKNEVYNCANYRSQKFIIFHL